MNYQKDRRRGRRHLGKNYPRGQVKREWSTSAKCCCKVNYDKGWKLSTRAVSNGALGPKARLQQIWKEYGLFFQEVSKWKEGNRQGVDGEKALKQRSLFVFILIWWERLPTVRGKEWKDWERYYWWNKTLETGENRILHINGEIKLWTRHFFHCLWKGSKGGNIKYRCI